MTSLPRALLVASLLGHAALPATATTVPAAAPVLQYEGRVAPQEDGSVALGFPGITLRTEFTGSHLALKAETDSPTVFLDVSVDGSPWKRIQLAKGAATADLFDGAAGHHSVTIVKRTEAWQGALTYISLEAPGEFTAPPPLPERKLMFVGDSITAGQNSDIDADEAHLPDIKTRGSNGRTTYGYRVARALHAQVHLVAYGGRGITRDWQGIPTEYQRIPALYERTLPDEPKSHWDHSQWVPDGIVVCIGQNDFNIGIPDEVQWTNAYAEFVRKLAADAPHAKIFLVNSPMNTDKGSPRRTALIDYVAEVVKMVDLPQVSTITVPHYKGVPHDGHPTRADHEKMAAIIAPIVKRRLGW